MIGPALGLRVPPISATTAPAAGPERGLPVGAIGGRVAPSGIARRAAERSQLPV
jgi:hypothetical protein